MNPGVNYIHIVKNLLKSLLTILLLPCYIVSIAQVSEPFYINGNAYREDCNCYTLTDDRVNEAGSAWNKNKIDLTQSFDFSFNVFLGCHDSSGADGIVFVLQNNDSGTIGANARDMGYGGITPSIGISIDTYQNPEYNDPSYDHIAIQKNGDLNHATANNLA